MRLLTLSSYLSFDNVLIQWTADEAYISKEINKKKRSENYFCKVIFCLFRETLLCITVWDRSDYTRFHIGNEMPHTWCRHNTWQEGNPPEQTLVLSFERNFERFMEVEISLQFVEDSLLALNLSQLNAISTSTLHFVNIHFYIITRVCTKLHLSLTF